MPSSLDFMSPEPVSNVSASSTAVADSTTPKKSASSGLIQEAAPAPAPAALAPASPAGLVFDNSAGRQQQAAIKKQASALQVPAPLAAKAPAPAAPAPAPAAGPSREQQAQSEREAISAAAVATPGTIQGNPAGYQALANGGQAESQSFLNQQAAQKASQDQATSNIQAQNAAATKAGVSAYYDDASGKWVDSTTGMPQVARSTSPVIPDEKYGSTQDGIIQYGQYGGLTTGQADAIEKAGQDVQDRIDPMIKKQQEEARQGNAEALIRSGQSGGFLNSQVSGKAASAVGGSWAGSGGTLNRLQTQYEDAVRSMQQEEAKAIQEAKDYALTAARVGNQQSYDVAQAAVNKVTGLQSAQQTAIDAQAKEMKSLSDIAKYETDTASGTISNLVANGYTDVDKLPKAYVDDLDKHLQAGGMPPGSARMIFATQKQALAAQKVTDEQKRQTAEIENKKNIVTLLKDVPQGKSVEIAGFEYTGLQKGDYDTGTETDPQGKVTHWAIDKDNPDALPVTTDLGYIGKPVDGWTKVQTDQGWFSYNPNTKQSVPLQPSTAQTTWQAVFPNGSQSPFRSAKDPMQGQCAAFCNDLYGQRILGDTFAEKQATFSKYPKVEAGDIQVGDSFLMSSGTTGHVGVVAGVTKGPDGKPIITALESNMVPPGGARISSTRTMSADDPKLKGIYRVPTPKLPQAGTDSPTTRAVLNGQPTINGKPISDVIGGTDDAKPLTVTEAKDLGVPFGTTRAQAAKMGITPKAATESKPLSADEITKYGLDPSKPENVGLTLPQVKDALTKDNAKAYADFSADYRKKNPKATEEQIKDDFSSQASSPADEIAAAIISGNQPPVLTGLYGKSAAVRAALQKKGFDLSRATQEWTATQKFISAANSQKQLGLQQSEDSVTNGIKNLRDLSSQFQRYGFAPANQAELAAAAQGVGPQKEIAAKYIAQINLLKDELGSVFMGGGSPTDKALGLATETLNQNYGMDQLSSALDTVEQNIGYRRQAMMGAAPRVQGGYVADKKATPSFAPEKVAKWKSGLKPGEKLYSDADGNPVAANPSEDDMSGLTPIE